MSEMVRKQFYIHRRHDALLKQLAEARGVSEAEVVRQAIEREATGALTRPLPPDHSAWQEILEVIESRKAAGPTGAVYHWCREDAYKARESRWFRQPPATETE
jgi:hypothetical protein